MKSTLESLALKTSNTSIPRPKGRWITRLFIPVGILVLALILLGFANREHLRPRVKVDAVAVAVMVAAAEDIDSPGVGQSGSPAGATVQAPGWVEPDPHPIFVTALADGVVEELLVLEGEHVKTGQVVARLVREDAELAVARTEAMLARRQAALAAAETDWQEPVELDRRVAVAEAELAETRARKVALQATLNEARALLAEAETVHQAMSKLTDGVAPQVDIDKALYQRDARRASLQATEARLKAIDSTIRRLDAELTAAKRNFKLRVDLTRQLEESRAAVAEAKADLDTARLRLQRMTVVSPADGVVMNRLVAPGAKVMLGMDGATSAHIVHIYDPERLQVRVDVPLSEASGIRPGQPAEIVVDVLPERTFKGRLTRFVHQADISKNTLQVKVQIESPASQIKPDMLARVKFLGGGDTQNLSPGSEGPGGVRIFVPAAALINEESSVWIVDVEPGRIRERRVVVGSARREGWREILQGLQVGDQVVVDPVSELADGMHVSVRLREE